MPRRIAVLASGGGSNLHAILTHFASLAGGRPGDVVLVASDRPDSGALVHARARQIEVAALDATERSTGLLPLLDSRGIDLVVLAGYLRMVPDDATRAFRGRIVNVHPALLPAFGGPGMYGRSVHEAVIARGVRVSGVTVHFVDEEYDHGPIIAQWPVPVFTRDDADSLARRVLEVEHYVYPRAVQQLSAGAITLGDDGRVLGAYKGDGASRFELDEDAGGVEVVLGMRRGTWGTEPGTLET